MTGRDDLSVQHVITAIGLSLKLFAPWPLLSMSGVGAEGIYQPVADTSGIVFVRFGSNETVEEYVSKLGGMFTEVSVIGDEAATVAGRPARRITVRIVAQPREMYRSEPGGGITHKTLAPERTVLTVIGFNNRGIPILTGYRMPEESLSQHKEQLEKILSSISVS
jgi:hypothetical protein